MKRYLKHDRYQLSLGEQHDIWRKIRFQSEDDTEVEHAPRKTFLPVFGLTTVTAAVLMAVIWWSGLGEKSFRQPMGMADVTLVKSAPADIPPAPKSITRLEAPAKGEGEEAADIHASVAEEEASTRRTGIELRRQESHTRGGRSDEVEMQIDGKKIDAKVRSTIAERTVDAQVPTRHLSERDTWADDADGGGAPGSVTGGTTPPNGETFEHTYFEHAGVNPFETTEEDALSTFAVDVDNASYTVARGYLQRGVLPPRDAVRVEEFVNFFDGGYPVQSEQDFVIHVDGAPSRFGEGYHLLRVGLQGRTVATADRKSANLVFVIDVSGSMGTENRLELVKRALHVLLDELREGDSVALVVYGSQGEIRLEPTDLSRRTDIAAAIDALRTEGSTNVHEGLELAYGLAREHYVADELNRLVLCSDGVANTGPSTEAEQMLARVRHASDDGITLSTIGFGMDNYNDVLMEKLADRGDGNYYHVDDLPEAERVFRENLTGTLQTIARQAKVQVEFDPRAVQRWRLLGYENRDVADRDFRNDDVDAGEVGAGHQVTALYEVKLTDLAADLADLGTIRLRFEAPRHDRDRAGQVTELAADIEHPQMAGDFTTAAPHLRLQAVVAEFAEILRGSYWARESSLTDLVPLAAGLAEQMPDDTRVAELADLIARAAELTEQDEQRRHQRD